MTKKWFIALSFLVMVLTGVSVPVHAAELETNIYMANCKGSTWNAEISWDALTYHTDSEKTKASNSDDLQAKAKITLEPYYSNATMEMNSSNKILTINATNSLVNDRKINFTITKKACTGPDGKSYDYGVTAKVSKTNPVTGCCEFKNATPF